MNFVIVSCITSRLALGLRAGAYARGRPEGGGVFDVTSEALVRARYTRTYAVRHADLSVRYTRTYPSVTRTYPSVTQTYPSVTHKFGFAIPLRL